MIRPNGSQRVHKVAVGYCLFLFYFVCPELSGLLSSSLFFLLASDRNFLVIIRAGCYRLMLFQQPFSSRTWVAGFILVDKWRGF